MSKRSEALATGFLMKKIKSSHFPWQLFFKTGRTLLVILTAFSAIQLALVSFLGRQEYQAFLPSSSFFLLLAFLISLFFFLRPLGDALIKIQLIQEQFNHHGGQQGQKSSPQHNEWEHLNSSLDTLRDFFHGQHKLWKDLEERNTTILEAVSDGILAIDLFESVIFHNSHFRTVFLSNDIKFKKTLIKLSKIFSQPEIYSAFRKALREEKPVELKGIKIEKSQGILFYFDVSLTPFFGQEKEMMGIVGVFHDVSQSKLTEQMRVDFVGNVGHEMRTPLTAIKGYAQMISADLENLGASSIPSYLEKINQNSDRLLQMFDNLLELSTIESRYRLEKQTIKLEELIKEIIADLVLIYPTHALSFELNFDKKDIVGDPKLLRHAFTNILDNIFKYNPGSAKVKISSESDEDFNFISFSDNGVGIPNEHLGRIFERFYRVDEGRDRKQGGTGIGLAIVKHVIQKHSGSIQAEKNIPSGIRFTIKLPPS